MDRNEREAIVAATREMLEELIAANDLRKEDVAIAYFSTTVDLNTEFPAVAARQLGWTEAALMCGHEMDVPGSLRHCIRVMVLVNTDKQQVDMVHVYLGGAAALRPDLASRRQNRGGAEQ